MGKLKHNVSMVSLYYIIQTLGKQAGATAEEILRFFLKNTIGSTAFIWSKIRKRLNFGVLASIFNYYNGKYWVTDISDDEDNKKEDEYYSSCDSSESISMEPMRKPLRMSARRSPVPQPIWMKDYFLCPPPDESARIKRAGQHGLIYSGLREHYGRIADETRWQRWVKLRWKKKGAVRRRGKRVGGVPCVARERNYGAVIKELANQVKSRHASIFSRGLKVDFTRPADENLEESRTHFGTLRDSQDGQILLAEGVVGKRTQVGTLWDCQNIQIPPDERLEGKLSQVNTLQDTQNNQISPIERVEEKWTQFGSLWNSSRLVFSPPTKTEEKRPHVSTLKTSQNSQVSTSLETVSMQSASTLQPPPNRTSKGADIIKSMGMEDLVTLVDNPLKQRRRQRVEDNARRHHASNDAQTPSTVKHIKFGR